jgi:hypothetical protein
MAKADPFLSLGFAAIDWIEHYLVHGPGDVQGQPINLDDEYAAFVVKAYRVDAKSGQKVVRRAFLSRPKGRAKSELAGMLDCFEALGPCRFDHWAEPGEVSPWGYEYEVGEPVGAPLPYVEILNVATEEGQAGNTYDNAYYMLHPDTCSPFLLADYGRIDVGLTRINLPGRRGFIEPVTASNESKDGGKSTFIVADETHLWVPPANPASRFKLGLMHQTMARNLLKRKLASGWMLETSTMYAEGEGSVAEGTHAYAKSPAGRGGKLLFDHRQASDGYDLAKRSERLKALREVYGPAAAWMPLGEIADSYDDPQVNPFEWERFWLTRPVPLEGPPTSILPGWGACAIGDTAPPDVQAIGVGVSLDEEWGAIAACGQWSDGRPNLGAVQRLPGTGWIPAEARRIQFEYGVPVVIDEKCPDKSLITALEAEGVNLTVAKLEEYVEACSDLRNRVKTREVTHMDHPWLNDAIRAAEWRYVSDRRVIGRKQSTGSVEMLEAAVMALRGWATRNAGDVLQHVW